MPAIVPPARLPRFPVLILGGLLLQTGCRPVRETAPGPTATPPVTAEIPTGYTRFRVVPAESEVRVLVYRDGPMARLGHNHVVSSRSLQGDVLVGDKGQDPRISLVLPVASFSVDQKEQRAEEGEDFPGVVDEDAISGTKKNMLSESLLDGAKFPEDPADEPEGCRARPELHDDCRGGSERPDARVAGAGASRTRGERTEGHGRVHRDSQGAGARAVLGDGGAVVRQG